MNKEEYPNIKKVSCYEAGHDNYDLCLKIKFPKTSDHAEKMDYGLLNRMYGNLSHTYQGYLKKENVTKILYTTPDKEDGEDKAVVHIYKILVIFL